MNEENSRFTMLPVEGIEVVDIDTGRRWRPAGLRFTVANEFRAYTADELDPNGQPRIFASGHKVVTAGLLSRYDVMALVADGDEFEQAVELTDCALVDERRESLADYWRAEIEILKSSIRMAEQGLKAVYRDLR